MPTVHAHFDGRSEDIEFDALFPNPPENVTRELDTNNHGVLGVASVLASGVKEALADHYDRPLDEFGDHTVEVHENGNITVRPKAVFGSV